MERIRSEIVSNLTTLQEEVRDITAHLDNLIEQNAAVVKELESITPKDLSSKRNYYLKITQQQHAAIQKLLTVNLELEEHLTTSHIENADSNSDKGNKKCETTSSKVSTPADDSLSESSDNEKGSSDGGNKADNSDMASDTGKAKVTVNDKLKRMNLLSRRERYERSLPKVNMPDLSFKKKTTSSVSSGSKGVVKNSAKENIRQVEDIKHQVLREPPELTLGLLCFISYIKSPSEFYVNYVDDNIQKLEKISQEASGLYNPSNSPYKSKKEVKNILGDFCLCYFEHWEVWYRVKVINWRMETLGDLEKNLTVFLVDYGHTLEVPYTCLRELLEKHSEVPQYAIKCHFAYLYPPGSTQEKPLVDWPSTSIKTLNDIIQAEEEIIFQIVYFHKDNSSYAVDLVIFGLEDDESTIGQKLIDEKVAVEIFGPLNAENGFIATQIRTAQGIAGVGSGMNEEELLDVFLKNIDTEEYGNLDEAVTGVQAKDEARTCKLSLRNGVCNRRNCKWDHAPLRKDGYTTDKHEVFTGSFTSISLPNSGSTITICITSIQKVNLWYGHLYEYVDAYAQLNKLLNATKTKLKPLQILPSLGELVIAKYDDTETDDSTYFRAMVKDVCQTIENPEALVQVFLVDTGDTIDLKLSNLRGITKELLVVPFYAVACRLYKIKEKEGVDFEEVVRVCESRYLNEWLHAEIVSVSPTRLTVDLEQYEGQSISKELVRLGFAEELEKDFEPLSAEHDLVD